MGGCSLAVVFRWPNRCLYGDWVAGLVVLVFGGHGMGCGLLVVWCLLVIGGFFFFFSFPILLVVSVLVGCV